MHLPSRRRFLEDVGRGMLVASVGPVLAFDLRLATAADVEGSDRLRFGSRERLVDLLQSSTPEEMLRTATGELQRGVSLSELTAAAALANARAFAGEDYVGFHTLMALRPALVMAEELTGPAAALPVLKVLYRNSARITEAGAERKDALGPVSASAGEAGGAEAIRAALHRRERTAAERALTASTLVSPEAGFNDLLPAMEDGVEVHRVVLAARAWDMISLVGVENASAMLRQSLRYCLKNEEQAAVRFAPLREMLPRVMDQFRLEARAWGDRRVDDGWVRDMVKTLWTSTPEQSAEAVAAAIVEGIAPDRIFEAISLRTNDVVLCDPGRRKEWAGPGKPEGSVHGDSAGVHASDAAHAWRTIALASNARQRNAALVLAAWHCAQDDVSRWPARPSEEALERVKGSSQAELLGGLDEAIRANDQELACGVASRYGAAGYGEQPVIDLLRGYAVSQDGALHAEKYYYTVCSNFRSTSPANRWKHLVALARVTASEYGRPAAGVEEAKELLGV
jgi:hypothetical protein